ncbi:hypothetical protein RyT2_27380 [Pseudolactococcus yaeyamensis]
MENTALNDLLNQQNQAVQQLRDYIADNHIDELVVQNEQLHDKIDTMIQQNQVLSAKISQQDRKIAQQRASVIDLLLELKAKYIGQNSQKLRKILGETTTTGYQKFAQSQKDFQHALHELEQFVQDLDRQSNQDLTAQIANLKQQAQLRFAQERELLQAKSQETDQRFIQNTAQEMLAQPIDEEVVEQTLSENKLETKIGLKVFNYIGIGFIFLAMIVLGRMGVSHVSDEIKSILLFATAFLFFAGGEYFRRKGKPVFSQGLLGGAFGIYYIATFISYFVFHLFSSSITLYLLLLIAVVSFCFATLYRSRAIGILATVGGYIPLISYLTLTDVPSDIAITIARIYVLLVTTAAVILAQRFKWQELTLIAFILLTPWLYIFGLAYPSNLLINLCYGFYFLALFIGLPLYINLQKTLKLSPLDMISAIGTLVNFSMLSLWAGMTSSQTILVLTLNLALYWGLSYYLEHENASEEGVLSRFSFIVGVIYSFIIALIWVPDHFATDLTQGLALILLTSSLLTYAYIFMTQKLRSRIFRVVSLLAAIAYYLTFLIYWFYEGYSLFSVLIGILSFAVMIASFVLINRSNFLRTTRKSVLTIIYIHGNLMFVPLMGAIINSEFNMIHQVSVSTILLLAMAIVVIVSRYFKLFNQTLIPVIHGSLIIGMTTFLDLSMLILNADLQLEDLMLLNLLNIAVFFLAYRLIKVLYLNQKISFFIAIISFSSYFMLNCLLIVYTSFNFAYLTISVDVIFGLIALVYIIYGFKRFLQPLRVTGLVLMLLAMAKLLLLDITYSSLLSRMLVFIVFGVLSLLISYSYQTVVKQYRETEAVLAQSDLKDSNDMEMS